MQANGWRPASAGGHTNEQIDLPVPVGLCDVAQSGVRGRGFGVVASAGTGAQMLDAVVNRQTDIIADSNDWKLIMLMALPMLLLLMRGSMKAAGADHAAVMD